VLLVFATSDKGGTGRSVTSSNVLYRSALHGRDVCYLDFDFGSPTAGAIFSVDAIARGTERGGLHSFLQDKEDISDNLDSLDKVDVWAQSERQDLRTKPLGAGRLMLIPGDKGGGEFPATQKITRRCANLFLRLQEEFDVCLVDLSAGRSQAVDIVLGATAQSTLKNTKGLTCRWLIFHRWTRQHILAAHGLVFGGHGLLQAGGDKYGHDRKDLESAIRFVRTAVVDPDSLQLKGMRPSQIAWLRDCDRSLRELASRHGLGRTSMLGSIPLDPMLQWREQLITDDDVWATQVANEETVKSFEELARKISDDVAWEGL
jgi:hypothetical protein